MNERQRAQGPLAIAAIASAGAAVMHATAAGIHADHPTLSRTFVAITIAQAAASFIGFLRSGRLAALILVAVNVFAFGGWLTTRFVDISWFPGLEVAEAPQLADGIAAILALVAVVAAASSLGKHAPAIPSRAVVNSAVLVGVMLVPGLLAATNHAHAEGDDHHSTAVVDDGHDHATGTGTGTAGGEVAASEPASTGAETSNTFGRYRRRRTRPRRRRLGSRQRCRGFRRRPRPTRPRRGREHGTRQRRSTSPAFPASPPSNRLAPNNSPLTRCATCPRSPTSPLSRRWATARSATPNRVRALHQRWLHRRRQVPRPHRSRVAGVRGRRRCPHARLGDVHRQRHGHG